MKTIFAILLMCFTSFAFAEEDVNPAVYAGEGQLATSHEFYSVHIDEEGGMAPPVEGDVEAGQLGQDPGAMGGEGQWEADENEGEEQPE